MKRRAFIAGLGGAAAWPLVAARGQQSKIWTVGYLHPRFWDSPNDLPLFEAFRSQLRELGYIEGHNLIIEKRAANGRYDALPDLAKDLVAISPDVIVAIATPAIAAAQKATTTILIIMTPSTDPIGSGFVNSFAHPGGNITGMANMFGDLTAKSLEIFHAAIPEAKTVCILMSSNPTHSGMYKTTATAAQLINLRTQPIVANTPSDLRSAFEDMSKSQCDGVFVLADPFRPTIVSLAKAFRIPAFYQSRENVGAGGFLSYGPSLPAMWRRSAQYVDKIFRGSNSAELPVEQPTKFELVINLNTAKELGLEIAPALLARADEVIE